MSEEVAASILSHPQYLVALWIHTELDPPEEQWSAVVQRLVRARHERSVPLDRVRSLVISDGGAPSATQRSSVARDLHEGVTNKLAVVTLSLSNPVKRGVATALSWLNPGVRFYRPAQFQDALVYLDLADQRAAVEREYRALKDHFGRLVRVFDQVAF